MRLQILTPWLIRGGTTCWLILIFQLLSIPVINTAHAAPGGGGGGMGGGPVCPPACPPNPANCDANLVITPTVSLRFGSMAAPTLGTGTVTVDTAGTRSGIGVILMPGGSVSAANFSMSTGTFSCTGRSLVTLSAGPSATLVHTGAPANIMTVDTFTTSIVAGDAFDPAVPLLVGATLHVNTNQLPGTYQGSYTVTVTFQ